MNDPSKLMIQKFLHLCKKYNVSIKGESLTERFNQLEASTRSQLVNEWSNEWNVVDEHELPRRKFIRWLSFLTPYMMWTDSVRTSI